MIFDTFQKFPVEALPESIRHFVTDAARAIQCDPAGPALASLAGCSAMIGNSRIVEITRTWQQPAVLWFGLVMESGDRKSAILKAAVGPIKKFESDLISDWKQQREHYESERQKPKKGGQPPIEPVCRRLVVDCITVEAQVERLEQNPRGLLLCKDELGGWLKSPGEYKGGGGGDLEQWLSMYDAASITHDRIGKLKYVPRAAVTIIGAIPPAILKGCLSGNNQHNGLSSRLLLAMPPRQFAVWTGNEISKESEDRLERIYKQLKDLPFGDDCEPTPLKFLPEVKSHWKKFYDDIQKQSHDLEGLEFAIHSKAVGLAARLALIIHLIRFVDSGASVQVNIDTESMQAAIALTNWLVGETCRVHRQFAETLGQQAERRAFKIIHNSDKSLTARDIMRHSPKTFPTRQVLDMALKGLVEDQKILGIPKDGDAPGRPTTHYRSLVFDQIGRPDVATQ